MNRSIWIGFDPREAAAFAVAKFSMRRHLTQKIPINGLILRDLQEAGLYRRPIEMRRAAADRPIMWDVISEHPMATQHANARFLVPHLARSGWAMFVDGDILVRGNVARLLDSLDSNKALYCVKHDHRPTNRVKMDGQAQSIYSRKNWSSVMIFNCDHPANRNLTLELINSAPGKLLHQFCWLAEEDIGALPPAWNWLVRHSTPVEDPQLVHFTEGVPDMRGYENDPFAEEWRRELEAWAA